MKVSILQENLAKGLSTVSRSVASRATLPILTNILLATDKGRLKLSATNLESGINLWLGAKVEEEGSITIPAKVLNEFVNSLPAEKIEMEVKQNSLIVTSGSFKADFIGTPATEFPQIPSFSGKPLLVFEKEELIKSLGQVIFAAAQDEGRPVLTGVLVKNAEGKITLVATDGYRLSIKDLNGEGKNLEQDLIIPAKTLLEVSRLVSEKKEEEQEIRLALTAEKSQVVFALSDVEFSSRLLEGEFPDFNKIIPRSFNTKAEFDKEEFTRAIKIASIFAREQANVVKFKIGSSANSSGLEITAETPQVGTNESQVAAKSEGEPLETAFNCRFLLDFLSAVKGEEIVFEANGSLAPGVFKIKGDESFLHIIMPVRLQG